MLEPYGFLAVFMEDSRNFVPANSVPAAAVRREGQALSVWTRLKTWLGGLFSGKEIP